MEDIKRENFVKALQAIAKNYPDYKEELTPIIYSSSYGNRKPTKDYKLELVDEFIDDFCKKFDISKDYFFKSRQDSTIPIASYKAALMTWCCFNINELDEMSLVDIGKYFGNKHWSTIIFNRDEMIKFIKTPRYNQRRVDIWHEVNEWFESRLID